MKINWEIDLIFMKTNQIELFHKGLIRLHSSQK
jgi:hypothetical protein